MRAKAGRKAAVSGATLDAQKLMKGAPPHYALRRGNRPLQPTVVGARKSFERSNERSERHDCDHRKPDRCEHPPPRPVDVTSKLQTDEQNPQQAAEADPAA